MRVLVSGTSGLVGGRLVSALRAAGHGVTRLVRTRPRGSLEYRWDPKLGIMDPAALAGCDAVVHLAGESIAAGRWTRARKAAILESRVSGTRLIARAIGRAVPPPRVLVCASAIGYYGDRGDETLDEHSPPGDGFLADVVRAWEAAAQTAAREGVRVVHPRLGVVLSARGGALPRLVLPFRLGLGGPLGTGGQWMSWITLDDLVRVLTRLVEDPGISGPVNAVAPGPVMNRDMARTIGRILSRPSGLPAPAWALGLLLGQMGRELLLFSQRVKPVVLETSGFDFHHRSIEPALRHVLAERSAG
ncbi:MAG TPA: TIGR01777 family oxidoreductase [Candidatus Eisenbacteria bacterium]|nr:TIGR01777 family oxidoreductase [Candidatus Eisenbacteria bacterium]